MTSWEIFQEVSPEIDKMDKIGQSEGVAAELGFGEEGYAKESIDKYLELFELLKDRKDWVYTGL